jgi:primosomal protein N' (replication factor Y)
LYVEIALPLPLPRTFTYRVPDAMRPRARPGARVLVPFGQRERIGWIDRETDPTTLPDPGKEGGPPAIPDSLSAPPQAPGVC